MELYIKVSFWIGLIGTVIRLLEMGTVDWPQVRKPKTLGAHVMETILGIAILIWLGLLLWH